MTAKRFRSPEVMLIDVGDELLEYGLMGIGGQKVRRPQLEPHHRKRRYSACGFVEGECFPITPFPTKGVFAGTPFPIFWCTRPGGNGAAAACAATAPNPFHNPAPGCRSSEITAVPDNPAHRAPRVTK